MVTRSVALLVLVGVLVGITQAEDKPAPSQRTLLLVKHSDVKDLATALSKHFKDDAEIQAIASSNALLVRSNAAVLTEITKLLSALDRPARLVSVEVYLVEVSSDADAKSLTEDDFTGPEKTVMSRLAELKKKSEAEVKRFQFTALEGSPVSLVAGASRAYTTGMGGGGFGKAGGAMMRSVSYRDLGTEVKLTARVSGGRSILLDLDVSDMRMTTSKDATPIGKDDTGAPVFAPEFLRTQFKNKLSIPPGKVVAAKDVVSSSKSSKTRTMVIATARVLDTDTSEK